MGRRITLSEAARLTGRHRNTIRNWLLSGRFSTAAMETDPDGSRLWRVDQDELLVLVPPVEEGGPPLRGLEGREREARIREAEARAREAEARADAAEAIAQLARLVLEWWGRREEEGGGAET